MPRLKSADKVEALRRQQAALAEQLKKAEAADREQQKERARRRQELAGRVALDLLETSPDSEAAKLLRAAMTGALKRPADRAMFPELPPLPTPAAPAPLQQPATPEPAPPPQDSAPPPAPQPAA